MAEALVRRFVDRLEVTAAPKSTSLVGDAVEAPAEGFDPFVAVIRRFLDAPHSAQRAFALAASAVMGAWMFPWCAQDMLAPGFTHAEYAATANTVLMGAISKTGKRSVITVTAATPLEGTVKLQRWFKTPLVGETCTLFPPV